MEAKGFEIPDGLSPKGRAAAERIIAFLKSKDRLYSGGCKVFYTPEQWKERGEQYGCDSLLIVVHDGGDHAGAFNYAYEQYDFHRQMLGDLKKMGVYAEQCTSWYSAVYEG